MEIVKIPNDETIDHFADWTDREFWTWLAGFFDGEGCVYLPKSGIGVDVSIANTNADVIWSIWNRVGYGTIDVVQFDTPRWKAKYSFRIRRWREARSFLVRLGPHLTIKQPMVFRALSQFRPAQERADALFERDEQIRGMRAEGLRHREIAESLGLKRSTVTRVLSPPPKRDRRKARPALESEGKAKRYRVSVKTRVVGHLDKQTAAAPASAELAING